MIDFLLSPLTWLLAALLVVGRSGGRRRLRLTAWLIAALSLFLITPLGANLFVHALESRVHVDASCATDAPPTVVVLAGGMEREPRDAADVTALSATTLRRVLVGAALVQQTAGARLVLSGGGAYAFTEGALMAELAKRLGVPSDAIEVESSSLTTWQSAFALAAHSPPLPTRFWLVSSALHLPRALMAFRAAGFAPCPVISDSRYRSPGGIGYLLPHRSSLAKSEDAVHEILGALAYRARAGSVAGR